MTTAADGGSRTSSASTRSERFDIFPTHLAAPPLCARSLVVYRCYNRFHRGMGSAQPVFGASL